MKMNIAQHSINKSKYTYAESEDQLILFSIGEIQFAVLCDGAGGYGGGYEAACACIAEINDYLISNENINDLPGCITNAIYKACFSASKHGQSTIIVIAIHSEGIVGASVGDSKALLYEHNTDHNLTQSQLNIRAGDGCIPVVFSLNRQPEKGSHLIIGSDGLWDFVKLEKIKEFVDVYEGESALNLAYKEATKNGVFDDFSMILFSF